MDISEYFYTKYSFFILGPEDVILLNATVSFLPNDTSPQIIQLLFKEDQLALEGNETFVLEIPSNITSSMDNFTIFGDQLRGTIQDNDGSQI